MRRCSPLLVLCLVCATLVLADPAGSDVVMTVTPDSDLSSGDVVTIEASGFPPTNIFFCEVLIALAPAPESCGAPTFVGSTDGSGTSRQNTRCNASSPRNSCPKLIAWLWPAASRSPTLETSKGLWSSRRSASVPDPFRGPMRY